MALPHSSQAKEPTETRATISGDLSNLKGCLTGLTGSSNGLAGEVNNLRGDMSGITGVVDTQLIGDVSGLRGDVTNVFGNPDGLRGQISDLVEQGLLWPKSYTLTLEMFASRYKLPMEFFDNSNFPALIAFHASQGPPLHWLAVRANIADGFIVGPLPEIQNRFPGQQIIKVAVPGDADWQICANLKLLCTDRIYVFEHIAPLLPTFTN